MRNKNNRKAANHCDVIFIVNMATANRRKEEGVISSRLSLYLVWMGSDGEHFTLATPDRRRTAAGPAPCSGNLCFLATLSQPDAACGVESPPLRAGRNFYVNLPA
jgi:hypothetical protein